MIKINRFQQSIPFLIVLLLLILLGYELYFSQHDILPSPLIGESLPYFQLPTLDDQVLTNKTLLGKPALLTVWASWCYACAAEQPMLMRIKKNYHVPIYGINYKDNPVDARMWLAKNGNPFILTGIDQTGDVGIDLGIYGTPETFVINREGKIIYRHIGTIDQHNWDKILYPLLKKE
jgi:cytochrome c biogenesis protein CcmG, thiol:disulfide interchange protein DsbE